MFYPWCNWKTNNLNECTRTVLHKCLVSEKQLHLYSSHQHSSDLAFAVVCLVDLNHRWNEKNIYVERYYLIALIDKMKLSSNYGNCLIMLNCQQS